MKEDEMFIKGLRIIIVLKERIIRVDETSYECGVDFDQFEETFLCLMRQCRTGIIFSLKEENVKKDEIIKILGQMNGVIKNAADVSKLYEDGKVDDNERFTNVVVNYKIPFINDSQKINLVFGLQFISMFNGALLNKTIGDD